MYYNLVLLKYVQMTNVVPHFYSFIIFIDPNAVTSFTEYELHKACKDSNYDAVSELLPNIPDIDVFDDAGYTPLHYACEVGNEGIVGLLIDKGANCRKISTNMSQTPPFHIACSRGYDQVVNKILSLCAEHKNDILETQDSNCCTPLHVACRPNHEKVICIVIFINFYLIMLVYCCMCTKTHTSS